MTDTDDDALELEAAEADAETEAEAEARADAAADAADALANGEDPNATDYALAFTPRNVAVGLAIVAGVVAFAISRRRRRRDGED